MFALSTGMGPSNFASILIIDLAKQAMQTRRGVSHGLEACSHRRRLSLRFEPRCSCYSGRDLVYSILRVFNLTKKDKEEVALSNSAHFVDSSGSASGTTAGKVDEREQFEFATELEDTWSVGELSIRKPKRT
jgi:hypothetical protein